MGRKYQVASQRTSEAPLESVYTTNMYQYNEPQHYLEEYYQDTQSFVQGKVQHVDEMSDVDASRHGSQTANVNFRQGYKAGDDYQSIKAMLDNNSFQNGVLINSNIESNIDSRSSPYQYTQYFAGSSSLPQQPSMFMHYPPPRPGSGTSVFGQFPCSNGIRGTPTYFEPGSTVSVRWQIEHPIEGGMCVIKLSKSKSEDPSSFKELYPTNIDVDPYTGYFPCGDTKGKPETVDVIIPEGTNCEACTLQLTYQVSGYGELYQCSDVSSAKVESTNDCGGECLNGSICYKGSCICPKGFYGRFCEQAATEAGRYVANEKSSDQTAKKKHRKSRHNGINYLANTPEAEVPQNYVPRAEAETGPEQEKEETQEAVASGKPLC